MCFGSSVSNSPLKSRILVVLVNAANWDSNGQFETVLSEILNEDIRESEVGERNIVKMFLMLHFTFCAKYSLEN